MFNTNLNNSELYLNNYIQHYNKKINIYIIWEQFAAFPLTTVLL